ncbi:MAG: flagellar assembly protein FliW [Treponema sp.]|nr:flagellar assembly protein FliW [Treponema sp.]
MKIATKAYGVIEVDQRQKIVLPRGLLGFEDRTEYLLLDAERQPFYWLQSMEAEDLAFCLVDPFLFRPDYEVDIGDGELAELGILSPEKALILAIVTIPQEGDLITANLQGPLVINRANRTGRQAVLSDSRWGTRHDIMAELAASSASAPAAISGNTASVGIRSC